MKGRILKKLTTCAVTAAMILGMTASVGATEIGSNGIGTITGPAGKTDTIIIKKDVQVFNTSGHQIYSPKITFEYSVEPVTELTNTTVTDENNNTAVVRDGVDGVVTVKSKPDFGAESSLYDATKDSSVTGTTKIEDVKKIRKNLELSVNLDGTGNSGINVPGIYRYQIKDTTDSDALKAAGIERQTGYDTIRYLDVYVVDDGNDGGVKLGGYVLFRATKSDVSITKTTSTTIVGGGEKTEGYVITSETTKEENKEEYLESNNKSDEYHTYNLKVTKDVTGDFGDRTHKFPFTVETDGNSADATFEKLDTTTEKVTVGKTKQYNPLEKLKNGESFTLYGLPNNTTYKITETNDTEDTYKVTITDESSSTPTQVTPTPPLGEEKSVAKNGTAVLEGETAGKSLTNDYISIKYTNKLDSVTPTGIFLRYAPYIIMAAAAIILIVAMRRRKSED